MCTSHYAYLETRSMSLQECANAVDVDGDCGDEFYSLAQALTKGRCRCVKRGRGCDFKKSQGSSSVYALRRATPGARERAYVLRACPRERLRTL